MAFASRENGEPPRFNDGRAEYVFSLYVAAGEGYQYDGAAIAAFWNAMPATRRKQLSPKTPGPLSPSMVSKIISFKRGRGHFEIDGKSARPSYGRDRWFFDRYVHLGRPEKYDARVLASQWNELSEAKRR